MACCAFAAFILMNLLVPLGLRRLRATATGNPAVAWRPGASALDISAPQRAGKRVLIGVIVIVQLALIGLFTVHHADPSQITDGDRPTSEAEWDAIVVANTVWCRGWPRPR
jgi:hypothetical protein